MNKIDRYVIEDEGGLLSPISWVKIRDRKDHSIVCEFDTGNKKLNKELAEYCLKRIEEDG